MPEFDRADAALGCLLGACIGDAAGGTLEFLGRPPRADEVRRALTFPGGGVFGLASGQITDDGELTLCLARALSGTTEFSPEAIATEYAGWIRSRPFDIGHTTASSLGSFRLAPWIETFRRDGYAAAMTAAARGQCGDSKANGSLMRSTPLGIWGWRLPTELLAEYARADSGLSHPNPSCGDAVACYAIAIAALLREGPDRTGAYDTARVWAETHAGEEVRGWLATVFTDEPVPGYPLAGFVRIAFIHAFRHLLRGAGFVEAIERTLLGGGDTDTNACIVGGLVGAACGAEAIPTELRAAVLGCDTQAGRQPRPAFLSTAQLPDLARTLLEPGS